MLTFSRQLQTDTSNARINVTVRNRIIFQTITKVGLTKNIDDSDNDNDNDNDNDSDYKGYFGGQLLINIFINL